MAVDYTPDSPVAAGEVVVQGRVVGTATRPIATDALGALVVRGILDVVNDGSVYAAGQAVYWDADADPVDEDGAPIAGEQGTGAATDDAASGTFMGFFLATASDGRVRILQAESVDNDAT
jgi:predicted RecA/RadA family phage recombinase